MSDDRMHDRLTDAGARWRERHPGRPVQVPPLRAGSPRLLVYGAAAAAVLAIAGGAWAVGQVGNGPGDQSAPTGTTSSTPSPTPTGTPDGSRSCSADELTSTRTMEGAMGTTYLTLTISGPDDACRLQGFPEVTLLADGHRLDVQVERQGDAGRPVRVTPSPSATLVLGWSPSHSCAGVDNDTIRVTLPDGTSFETPGFGQTSCSPGEADLQPLVVQPFTDAQS